MRKSLYAIAVLLVAAISFSSCQADVNLKDNIVKYKNYEGTDSDNDAWTATFTETTFTASCPSSSINLSGTNWTVTQNADNKTGTITINGVTATFGSVTTTINITGTIDDKGATIILTSGKLTITLKKA